MWRVSIASGWVNFARREGHAPRFSAFRIGQPIVPRTRTEARTRVTVILSFVPPPATCSTASRSATATTLVFTFNLHLPSV